MEKTLITQEKINPIEVFVADGLSGILASINEKARSFVPDLSTDKSRKEIATLCYKIKRSKTYIDGIRKEYVTDLKRQPKIADAEGKRARDYLDALEEDIRSPLTKWEADEKKRKDFILKRVNDIDPFKGGIIAISVGDMSAADIRSLLATAFKFPIDDTLMEMEEMARMRKDEVVLKLSGLLSMQEKADAEKAELLRLQAEAAERAQQERVDLAAKEAKEEAERVAEEARVKAEQDAADKISTEKKEKEDAEQRLIDEKAAAERREEALKQQAIRDTELAVQQEKDRVEQQAKADKEAQEKREANKRHCAKINNQCIKDFMAIGLNKEQAKDVVIAIAKGIISNVSIKY